MTPEKQDKTLELSKHWSADSTPAKDEVIMKTTYPVKSVKCDKICSNYTNVCCYEESDQLIIQPGALD